MSEPHRPITVAVLTVSDRCSLAQLFDTSGLALCQLARTHLRAQIAAMACVPDEPAQITPTLRRWALQSPRPDLI